MNLFNLAGYAEHKALWSHPYHARRTAIDRCLERAELNCDETRIASLRHANARIESFQKLFEALTGR
jgi:hypothetical protein